MNIKLLSARRTSGNDERHDLKLPENSVVFTWEFIDFHGILCKDDGISRNPAPGLSISLKCNAQDFSGFPGQ
jgi:hypothetical protein